MTRDPVVVVGGGTAGCMVTSYLANNTDLPIVLVEPGKVSSHDENSRFFDALGDADLVRTVNGVPQARVLGGGSAINGMLLTGEEPTFARGLTRMAHEDDIGLMGRFLLSHGGRFSRLWWNGARWNPGRAVHHLEEEGRISIVRDEVESIQVTNNGCTAVTASHIRINASTLVLCAGALETPRILQQSHQLMHREEAMVQNHYSVNLVARLTAPSRAPFDTAVVREMQFPTGEMFMVNAYERVSNIVRDHGLMTVSHMNPRDGRCDVRAMEKAKEILEDLANSLRMTEGIEEVVVSDEILPLSHVTASCAHLTDSDGRVHGVPGVWVADASVLRQVPTCTPAAPVTMEALRIAQIIAGELS